MSQYFHNIHYAIKVRGRRTALLAAIVGLAAASPFAAAAQNRSDPIRVALAEVRVEENKARPLLQRMQALAAQNDAKKKDYDATDAQMKALQPRLDRYAANVAKHDAQVADYSKRVDSYNARCGGTAPLPQDKYRACLGEKGELAGRKVELDTGTAALEAERRALESEINPRTARLESIRKEMNANLLAFEKTARDYKVVYDRIDGIRKRLVGLCADGDKARDPFAVRLCVGAGWDPEKKDFAGLTDLPPPVQ